MKRKKIKSGWLPLPRKKKKKAKKLLDKISKTDYFKNTNDEKAN